MRPTFCRRASDYWHYPSSRSWRLGILHLFIDTAADILSIDTVAEMAVESLNVSHQPFSEVKCEEQPYLRGLAEKIIFTDYAIIISCRSVKTRVVTLFHRWENSLDHMIFARFQILQMKGCNGFSRVIDGRNVWDYCFAIQTNMNTWIHIDLYATFLLGKGHIMRSLGTQYSRWMVFRSPNVYEFRPYL